jgi:hypothetical protein
MGIIQSTRYAENGDWSDKYGCKHISKDTKLNMIKWKEVDMQNFSCNVPTVMSGTSQMRVVKDKKPGLDCIEVS